MLYLGLSLPFVVGVYKIYTEFFPWYFSNIAIIFLWSCTLTCVFSCLPYRTASYFFTMNHVRYIKFLVTHHLFWIPSRKERNTLFYVDSVITFGVFSELLWKSTLLVCYKLNRFHPPQVNQFDISLFLFGGYARFVLLDKMVLYN